MLKKFFLNTLSSFVGAWIALILFGVVGVIVAVGLVVGMHGTEEVASVKKHSILTLELSGSIVESETPTSFNYTSLMSGGIEKPQTLNVIVEGLKEGADNKNIDALYIKCGAALASPATFLIKLTVVVLVALTCVACVRLFLSSATAETAMESQQLTASIDEARSNGAALEVSLGSLTNPTRVRDQAKALGMVAPETTAVITVEEDIVMCDQAGNLSLSSSVEAAHERGV